MSIVKKAIPEISRNLFVDTDFSRNEWEHHTPYVIEWGLSRDSRKDFKTILAHYGRNSLKEAVVKFRYLDQRTF